MWSDRFVFFFFFDRTHRCKSGNRRVRVPRFYIASPCDIIGSFSTAPSCRPNVPRVQKKSSYALRISSSAASRVPEDHRAGVFKYWLRITSLEFSVFISPRAHTRTHTFDTSLFYYLLYLLRYVCAPRTRIRQRTSDSKYSNRNNYRQRDSYPVASFQAFFFFFWRCKERWHFLFSFLFYELDSCPNVRARWLV